VRLSITIFRVNHPLILSAKIAWFNAAV